MFNCLVHIFHKFYRNLIRLIPNCWAGQFFIYISFKSELLCLISGSLTLLLTHCAWSQHFPIIFICHLFLCQEFCYGYLVFIFSRVLVSHNLQLPVFQRYSVLQYQVWRLLLRTAGGRSYFSGTVKVNLLLVRFKI